MPSSEKPQLDSHCPDVGPGWRFGRQLAGWGLVMLGVAGLVLPILPGWIFLAWGAVTLAPDVPFIGRLLDRVAQHVPALRSAIEKVRGMSES